MYIIIIGCGRMGSALAMELADAGYDVAVIDRDPMRLESLGSGFNGNRIKGVEYDRDTLQQAGISYADVFLAMTPEDNINITGAQIARDVYRVPRVIARISDPQKEFIYKKLNLETICPTQTGVSIVRSRILNAGSNLVAYINGGYELVETVAALRGRHTVGWLEERCRCRVAGLSRAGHMGLVSPEELILEGDRLFCMVSAQDREQLTAVMKGEAV